MKTPFKESDIVESGFVRKLFKLPLNDEFEVRIENLLSIKQPDEINVTEINQIRSDCNMYSQAQFDTILCRLYLKALDAFLSDSILSSEERIYLNSLRVLFEIDAKQVDLLERTRLFELYCDRFEKIMKENSYTEENAEKLKKISAKLSLNKEVEHSFYSSCVDDYCKKLVMSSLEDERINASEYEILSQLKSFFGIEINYNPATEDEIDLARSLWNIENGKLGAIKVDYHFKSKEECYYQTDVGLTDFKQKPLHINFNGMNCRKNILNGVYWKMSYTALQDIEEDRFNKPVSGISFITNRRIIIKMGRANKSIFIKSVIDYAVFHNAVILHGEKDSYTVLLMNNTKHFAMVLALLLR